MANNTNHRRLGTNNKSGAHVSPRVVFHVPLELQEAFNSYINSLPEPVPDRSRMLRAILKEFLRAKGFI